MASLTYLLHALHGKIARLSLSLPHTLSLSPSLPLSPSPPLLLVHTSRDRNTRTKRHAALTWTQLRGPEAPNTRVNESYTVLRFLWLQDTAGRRGRMCEWSCWCCGPRTRLESFSAAAARGERAVASSELTRSAMTCGGSAGRRPMMRCRTATQPGESGVRVAALSTMEGCTAWATRSAGENCPQWH